MAEQQRRVGTANDQDEYLETQSSLDEEKEMQVDEQPATVGSVFF